MKSAFQSIAVDFARFSTEPIKHLIIYMPIFNTLKKIRDLSMDGVD
jgi:hypothetical protein